MGERETNPMAAKHRRSSATNAPRHPDFSVLQKKIYRGKVLKVSGAVRIARERDRY